MSTLNEAFGGDSARFVDEVPRRGALAAVWTDVCTVCDVGAENDSLGFLCKAVAAVGALEFGMCAMRRGM